MPEIFASRSDSLPVLASRLTSRWALKLSVEKLVEFIGGIEFELGALNDRKMRQFVWAVSLRS